MKFSKDILRIPKLVEIPNSREPGRGGGGGGGGGGGLLASTCITLDFSDQDGCSYLASNSFESMVAVLFLSLNGGGRGGGGADSLVC